MSASQRERAVPERELCMFPRKVTWKKNSAYVVLFVFLTALIKDWKCFPLTFRKSLANWNSYFPCLIYFVLPSCVSNKAFYIQWHRDSLSQDEPQGFGLIASWPGEKAEPPCGFSTSQAEDRRKAPGLEVGLQTMTWQQTLIKWNLTAKCLLIFTCLKFQTLPDSRLKPASVIISTIYSFWKELSLTRFQRVMSSYLQCESHYVCP